MRSRSWLTLFLVCSACVFADKTRPPVQKMAARPEPTANQDEDPIAGFLKKHGGYTLKRAEAVEAQAALQKLTDDLNPNPAKRITPTFINSSDVNAFVYRSHKGDKVGLFHGVFGMVSDLDEFAAIVAHETSHTKSFDKPREDWERALQSTREEIMTADRGAMELMLQRGYDPRALRRVILKLEELDYRRAGLGLAIGSHPSNSLRLTAIDAWLSQNENKLPPETIRPLPAILQKLAKTPPPQKTVKPIATQNREARPPNSTPDPIPELPKEQEWKPHPGPLREYTMAEVLAVVDKTPDYQNAPTQKKIEILRSMTSTAQLLNYAKKYIDPSIPDGFIIGGEAGNYYLERSHGISFRPPNLEEIQLLSERVLGLPDLGSKELREVKIEAIDVLWTRGLSRDAAAAYQDRVQFVPQPKNLKEYKASSIRYDDPNPQWGSAQRDRAQQSVLENSSPDERIEVFEEWSRRGDYARFSNELKASYKALVPEIYERAVQLQRINIILGTTWLPVYYDSGVYPAQRYYEPNKGPLLFKALSDPRIGSAERLIIAKANAEVKYIEKGGATLGDQWDSLLRSEIEDFQKLQAIRERFRVLNEQKAHYATLYAPDLLRAFELHPEWKLSFEEVVAIAKDPAFWKKRELSSWDRKPREYSTTEASTRLAEAALEKQGKGALSALLKTSRGGLQGPGYEYDSKHSRRLQTLLITKLQEGSRIPKDALQLHQLLFSLASRGPSPELDAWASNLYLEKEFQCRDCLEEVLENRTCQDLDYRKKIYDKWLTLRGDFFPKTTRNRIIRINREVDRINRFFPEESLARAQALEGFANLIHANQTETKIIDAAKRSQNANAESIVLRFLDGVLGVLRWENRGRRPGVEEPLDPLERQLDFILFLQGKKELHSEILEDFNRSRRDENAFADDFVTSEQLQRHFSILPPAYKALALNPMLTGKDGVYQDRRGRKALLDLATEGMGEYRSQAKLLLEALLHGLNKVAPYQETLAVAYILGQGGGKEQPAGLRLRNVLASLGNSGTSIGQKLYQRRLVPAEFMPYLRDFQDSARETDRIQIFERIAQILKVPDLDDVLILEEKLGEASTKIVCKVRYKDGRVASLTPDDPEASRALKILWEDLKRSNELEKKKLAFALDYLEEHGGPGYRKLRSVLKAVARGLDRQSDARAEVANYDKIRQLYQTGKVEPSGFVFDVVEKDLSAGASEEHLNEKVAPGVSLSKIEQMGAEVTARVFGAIYDKEESVLFAEPTDGKEVIEFETDRHGGNYKVDLTSDPPRITLLDYPLMGEITVKQRGDLFKLFGFVDRFRESGGTDRYLARQISELLNGSLSDGTVKARRSVPELQKALLKSVAGVIGSNPHATTADLVYDIIGTAEAQGTEVHLNVHDYLVALGNAQDFSHYKSPASGASPLNEKMRTFVEREFSGFKPQLTFGEKCSYFLQRLNPFRSQGRPKR
jgi:hypothetical protein